MEPSGLPGRRGGASAVAASHSVPRYRPRVRTALIEGGRLRTYLHNAYTARRGGAERAGNGQRAGYRSPPAVSFSNLIVEAGELTTPELLATAGDAVYVTDVAGLHSG